MAKNLTVIGCGVIFEAIRNNWQDYSIQSEPSFIELKSTDEVSDIDVNSIASSFDQHTKFFAAIDSNAINFARLDLYRKLRIIGLKADNVTHKTSYFSNDLKRGENVYIGSLVNISHDVEIGNNVSINSSSALESKVVISSHAWIGSGSQIGHGVHVGSNSIIGNRVQLNPEISVGKNCVLNNPGLQITSVDDGSFYDPLFPSLVKIY